MITTNHPDKIGKALARKGRLDLKIYFGYASNDEIKEYFINSLKLMKKK